MISVVEHVIYPKTVMSEIYRVLKPSGTLYISCPMRHVTWRSELRKLVDKRFCANRHVTDFDEHSLLKLVSNNGFVVRKKEKSVEVPKNLFLSAEKQA